MENNLRGSISLKNLGDVSFLLLLPGLVAELSELYWTILGDSDTGLGDILLSPPGDGSLSVVSMDYAEYRLWQIFGERQQEKRKTAGEAPKKIR